MLYILIPILIFLSILSIVLIWLNLPGTFINILLSGILVLFFNTANFNILLIGLIICIFFEILEFLLNTFSIKVYGGKNSSLFISILGSILGACLGSIIFPIIGTLIGLLLGGYLSVFLNEIKDAKNKREAIKISNSIVLSYILSKGIKTIFIIFYNFYLTKLFI
tara:strand:+ start:73 stop:567 length:495 start_codon:yes stop_codon:yes gene_type:complete